jgi:LPXTG-site transpeptidase (sortase) family protein
MNLPRLGPREVTLYDTDAGGPLERLVAPRRRSFAAATLIPAVVAAAAGALLAPALGGDDLSNFGPEAAVAKDLARAAAQPPGESHLTPLVPVVERDGHPRLAANGAPPAAAGPRPAAPFWISIPAAGVESPVDPVGSTSSGLALPASGRTGWWDGGPRPGEDGRAVIVGHLDSRKGPDVFAKAPELGKGDSILVRDHAGRTHRYAVVGVTRVRKADFPTADVYGPASRPVLVLVTCGGPYDESIGHYRDNVLVYARAAG